MNSNEILDQSLILIPAFNEQGAIGALIDEIREAFPNMPIMVINDASSDKTSIAARRAGAAVLDLPFNLGVAGAMQAGFRYALQEGYRFAIRCDGDGQHPPSGIPKLVEEMARGEADLVVGSRHLEKGKYDNSFVRHLGITYLSLLLSHICKHRITDPTSGFQMLNHTMLYYFSNYYPADYPEPESLALLRRHGYEVREVGVDFRQRKHGTSSLNAWSSIYYAIKVTFALVVDRARSVNTEFSKQHLLQTLDQP